uniref:Uncharacterized protein n=1 Tax=Leersia perrieri TaxID=77586 RepID=A0A0D9VRG4_9ORYZ
MAGGRGGGRAVAVNWPRVPVEPSVQCSVQSMRFHTVFAPILPPPSLTATTVHWKNSHLVGVGEEEAEEQTLRLACTNLNPFVKAPRPIRWRPE